MRTNYVSKLCKGQCSKSTGHHSNCPWCHWLIWGPESALCYKLSLFMHDMYTRSPQGNTTYYYNICIKEFLGFNGTHIFRHRSFSLRIFTYLFMLKWIQEKLISGMVQLFTCTVVQSLIWIRSSKDIDSTVPHTLYTLPTMPLSMKWQATAISTIYKKKTLVSVETSKIPHSEAAVVSISTFKKMVAQK